MKKNELLAAKEEKSAQKKEERLFMRRIERAKKVADETGEFAIGLLPKRSISLRLEPMLIEWFKAHDEHYQTFMRCVLKEYAAKHSKNGLGEAIRKARKAK